MHAPRGSICDATSNCDIRMTLFGTRVTLFGLRVTLHVTLQNYA
jgi:hypothetical protein